MYTRLKKEFSWLIREHNKNSLATICSGQAVSLKVHITLHSLDSSILLNLLHIFSVTLLLSDELNSYPHSGWLDFALKGRKQKIRSI